jgi:serine/threonine protein phosphatase PrpC
MNRSLDLLRFGGDSDTGLIREHNEDRLLLLPELGIFGVVDGMGGHRAGEKAAEIAVAVLKANFLNARTATSSAERIRQIQLAVLDANNQIYEMGLANEEWHGMACVLTIAMIREDMLTVGHVGDSRLYRVSRNKIEKLTRDHSPVGMREDANELTEAEAMHDSRRHEVLRDVGSELRPENDYNFADVFEIPFDPTTAIVLCSDGLTDMVTAADILQVVKQSAGDPVQTSRDLIRIANEAGGHDNVTAIVIEGTEFKSAVGVFSSARITGKAGGRIKQALAPFGSRMAMFLYGLIGGIALLFSAQTSPLFTGARNPAETIRVSSVGGRYATISDALAAAQAGDRIEVEPGNYNESLVVPANVSIISTVPHGATIRPRRTTAGAIGIVVAGGNVQLAGFKVEAGEEGLDVGIRLKDAIAVISNFEIGPATTAGIQIDGNTSGLIRGNALLAGSGSNLVIAGDNSVAIEVNWFGGSTEKRPTIVLREGSAEIRRNIILTSLAAGEAIDGPAAAVAEILRANRIHVEDNR